MSEENFSGTVGITNENVLFTVHRKLTKYMENNTINKYS